VAKEVLNFSFRRAVVIQGDPGKGKIRKKEEEHEKGVITL